MSEFDIMTGTMDGKRKTRNRLLTASVRESGLWVTSRTWITQLLPGGERSRFQPKLVFDMERADAPAQPGPGGF